jgi:hypothetical protein
MKDILTVVLFVFFYLRLPTYSVNTSGWLVGSPEGCNIVDIKKDTRPARNATDPILNIGRSNGGVVCCIEVVI